MACHVKTLRSQTSKPKKAYILFRSHEMLLIFGDALVIALVVFIIHQLPVTIGVLHFELLFGPFVECVNAMDVQSQLIQKLVAREKTYIHGGGDGKSAVACVQAFPHESYKPGNVIIFQVVVGQPQWKWKIRPNAFNFLILL